MRVRIANAFQRMLPGILTGRGRDHYSDFRLPETVTPDMLRDKFRRNGLAHAAIMRTVAKTWQDDPWLLEYQRDDGDETAETMLEAQIRKRFDAIHFWRSLTAADARALVGGWSAVILRYADNLSLADPVARVPGGLDGLVGILPIWRQQLSVERWDMDLQSPTYGEPVMYLFHEAPMDGVGMGRDIRVHPDRVLIWSADGTRDNDSILLPGFNDLVTMEKISGAGGEGFWRNAKAAPVLEVSPDVDLARMADAAGIDPKEFGEKVDRQVEKFLQGFDQMLMLQGMSAKPMNVSLPSPREFFDVALGSFAASVNIPQKILIGSQTGERASTEDAAEWAQTNMARRNNMVRPCISALVDRLELAGILPERDWFTDWSDLTEASAAEKIDRANKMADINVKSASTGELVFLGEEIRFVAGYEPLSDEQRVLDDLTGAEARAAMGNRRN